MRSPAKRVPDSLRRFFFSVSSAHVSPSLPGPRRGTVGSTVAFTLPLLLLNCKIPHISDFNTSFLFEFLIRRVHRVGDLCNASALSYAPSLFPGVGGVGKNPKPKSLPLSRSRRLGLSSPRSLVSSNSKNISFLNCISSPTFPGSPKFPFPPSSPRLKFLSLPSLFDVLSLLALFCETSLVLPSRLTFEKSCQHLNHY